MSKRRKYNIKNKRSFIIILLLSIVITFIFSLFIYKFNKAEKVEYVIESGSVLQDVLKNYITIDDDAVLKIRWNGNYYLIYNDEKIDLGKKVIVYNTITGGMKLYGNFYEIASDGKVVENKNETILANTTDCKFYKLADREYLLVDAKIYSDDKSIQANNYLLVELDKLGNAKLSNNSINLKTISPTKLITSKYSFDIANEILNFGKYDIDLKKIIGSTNQYTPEDDDKINGGDNGEGADNNGNDNTGGSSGIGTGEGNGNGVINNGDDGNINDMEDILNKVKMTSIIRVVEGLTQIDIDYVIYDPYNEYQSVYVEVVSKGKVEVIYLSKKDTHITLGNLLANENYRLNFIYTTSKINEETGESELVPYTFEQFDLKTKKPEYGISVYKISKVYNTLTYKVNLQSGYNISKVNVGLSFDYDEIDEETGEMIRKKANLSGNVDIDNMNAGYILGTFDISNYDIAPDTLISLTVKSVVSNGVEMAIGKTSTFRFGR